MEMTIQQVKSLLKPIKQKLEHKAFWVFTTLSCLGIFHFCYVWTIVGNLPSLLDVLGWGSIGFLLWQKRHKLKFRGGFLSSIIGLVLILWMVVRHIFTRSQTHMDVLSHFFPIIITIGILLILSGFKKIINYRSELLVATFISLPIVSLYIILKPIINIDAQFLGFILHYIGFQVVRQNATVSFPNGSVEIMGSCSSVGPILTILPFIVVMLNIYPVSKSRQIFVYLSTIISVVCINNIRLSILAILINNRDKVNFDYWHTGGGAGIFSNIIVFFVGCLCYQILNHNASSSSSSIRGAE